MRAVQPFHGKASPSVRTSLSVQTVIVWLSWILFCIVQVFPVIKVLKFFEKVNSIYMYIPLSTFFQVLFYVRTKTLNRLVTAWFFVYSYQSPMRSQRDKNIKIHTTVSCFRSVFDIHVLPFWLFLPVFFSRHAYFAKNVNIGNRLQALVTNKYVFTLMYTSILWI